MTRTLLCMVLGCFGLFAGCKDKTSVVEPPPVPPPDETPVPPAAAYHATPVANFADAGNLEGKSPLERARIYEANGQLWLARLLIEKEALLPEGDREAAELLARICAAQADAPCAEACGNRLGRTVALDAGKVPPTESPSEHREPPGTLARARDFVLHKDYEAARALLEPKVLDGKASKEEIRLLKTACSEQGDRMCVALCTTKLR